MSIHVASREARQKQKGRPVLQRLKLSLGFGLALLVSVIWSQPLLAAAPIVRAVLFYSPTCPHCHKVITESLPPLTQKYGPQLEIGLIDTTTPQGEAVYAAAVQQYKISADRQGVPTLIVGSSVLVGEDEIPGQLPALIDAGLRAGGIDWPTLPGLVAALPSDLRLTTLKTLSLSEKLALDPLGNGLAIIILIGMLALVGRAVYRWGKQRHGGTVQAANHTSKRWRKARGSAAAWRVWAIPALVVVGLVVSGYLSFVELTASAAVCGPVGDCNAVQQSDYARLFGILPVGVLGFAGNLAIGTAWALKQFGPKRLAGRAQIGLIGLATVGILFSIYLTFLEPFVIGAVCAWCLTSALVMSGLFELSFQST